MEDYIKQGACNHVHALADFDFDHVKVVELEEGHAVVEAVTATGFANTRNFIHGGVLMALCDMTVSAAVYTYAKRNVTLQSSFNFFRGLDVDDGARMICDARVVHNGRKTVVADAEIRDAQGRVCVKGTFTQFVVGIMGPDDPMPLSPMQASGEDPTLDISKLPHID